MARPKPRKELKTYLTANGASSREDICAAVVAAAGPEVDTEWVEEIIDRMHGRGKLTKVGENYDLPV